jgi:asparagine synthase (glutamine-hydrolysing)
MPKIQNLEVLQIYLTLSYIPAPFTFYKDIHKLKAGHCLIIQGKEIRDYQYWDLPEIDENEMIRNKGEVFENFEYLFRDSVKIRMRSDVPYGAFLSGGLDSSSIVALMSEISTFPVETFTIGFKEKHFDERYLANLVANKFHTNHHEYIVEPETFNESLNKISYHYDEPFGDSSAIPTGYVSQFASSKVKMVLTGDGGDEVLSGYTIYQHEKYATQYQKLPYWIKNKFPVFLDFISESLNGSLKHKINRAKIVSFSSNMNFQNRYLYKTAAIDLSIIKSITNDIKMYPIEEFIGDFMKKYNYKDPFYQLMYLNLKLSLPNDMLVKVDRMSMAHSLETRAPFLDFRLIEYMAGVHKNIKMHNYERKTILKRTIAQKLPKKLLVAPKKGFSVPLSTWFKTESFTSMINDLENNLPFLDKNIFRELIRTNKYDNGNGELGNFIWMLFVLNEGTK